MDFIIDFLKDNYRWIVDLIVLFVGFLLLRKKKIKVSSTGLIEVLESLPDFINQAESLGLTGSDKLSMVMSLATAKLVEYYGDSILDNSNYIKVIENQVENILSTPQKK